jgi:hypothetical protein
MIMHSIALTLPECGLTAAATLTRDAIRATTRG